jgi:versiconal hemiacetal acetate esterase
VDDLQRHFAQLGGAIVSKLTFPAPDTSVKTEDKKLSPEVTVRIYTPAGYTGGRPAGLFMHGGGWVFGDSESEDGFCRQIAKDAGVVLVSVDYRLAPKHRYPAALDDCITAYRWVVENAGYLNVIKGKIFTIGGSAGGGLALATSPRLIDEGLGDSVKGVVALVPVTVHLDACPENLKPTYTAYQENANSTINTASAMLTFFGELSFPNRRILRFRSFRI